MEGVFSGTFRFRGERGYVETEATRVHGEMHVVPPRKCAPRRASLSSRPHVGRAGDGEDTAVISALRDQRAGFAALAHRDPREPSSTSFIAATFGWREGMRVYRYAYARARASAFEFSLRKGTAVVRPPWPFQGGARFQRAPHGRNSWDGALRVQLLGVDPVDLATPGFRATMKDEYFDE
jgi:hypothetical protein